MTFRNRTTSNGALPRPNKASAASASSNRVSTLIEKPATSMTAKAPTEAEARALVAIGRGRHR